MDIPIIKQTLKVLMLVITLCCVCLHCFSLESNDAADNFTVGGTFVAFLIVGSAALFELCMEPFLWTTELYFHLAGMLMFLVSTSTSYTLWASSVDLSSSQLSIALAKAILAGFNVLLYTISAFLCYKF